MKALLEQARRVLGEDKDGCCDACEGEDGEHCEDCQCEECMQGESVEPAIELNMSPEEVFSVAKDLAALLADAGYEVVEAPVAESALEFINSIAEAIQDNEADPDLRSKLETFYKTFLVSRSVQTEAKGSDAKVMRRANIGGAIRAMKKHASSKHAAKYTKKVTHGLNPSPAMKRAAARIHAAKAKKREQAKNPTKLKPSPAMAKFVAKRQAEKAKNKAGNTAKRIKKRFAGNKLVRTNKTSSADRVKAKKYRRTNKADIKRAAVKKAHTAKFKRRQNFLKKKHKQMESVTAFLDRISDYLHEEPSKGIDTASKETGSN